MSMMEEQARFAFAKKEWIDHAKQTAALFVLCGVDLQQALASSGEERSRIVAKLRRFLERERMRGLRRHWSYDLNRHIALKQALDRLRAFQDGSRVRATGTSLPQQKRRRSAVYVST